MIIIIRTGTTRQAWWRCNCCGRGGRSSRSSTGGTTLSSEMTSKSSSYHNHYLRDGPHSQVRLRQNHHNHIQNHYHHHYFHELILIAIITLIRIKILYQVAATFAKHALSAGLTSHNLTAHLVWRWVWTDHNWTLIFKVESWTWSKSQIIWLWSLIKIPGETLLLVLWPELDGGAGGRAGLPRAHHHVRVQVNRRHPSRELVQGLWRGWCPSPPFIVIIIFFIMPKATIRLVLR